MAECGVMPASLLEALASTIKSNNAGEIYFNVVYYDGGSEQDIFPCGGESDLAAYIVANGFGVDANGMAAIKLRKPV